MDRNTEIRKKQPMALQEREPIIQQIVDEVRQVSKESGKTRLFMEWRAKLAKEPLHLSQHQIDEVVREVRRRLETASG